MPRIGLGWRCSDSQPAAVVSSPLTHFGAPVLMLQVPAHRFRQSLFHIVARALAQLGTDAGWVNRVAAVVAWAVGDWRDQVGVGS